MLNQQQQTIMVARFLAIGVVMLLATELFLTEAKAQEIQQDINPSRYILKA
jgi:hypothetical protein